MSLETQVNALVSAATELTSAARVKKSQLDQAVSSAQTHASAAAASFGNVNTINVTAGASAAAAQAAAAAAVSARDTAIAAWSASTAPTEQLPGLSQAFHHGEAVGLVAADTSEDSDGGAWAIASQHTSWYNETLGGDRWIGRFNNQAAAWAAAGNAPGAVFQATETGNGLIDGKFYVTVNETTSNVVIRGISRDWPSLPVVLAERNRVVIYDGSAPGCPMWRVIDAVYDGVVMLASQNVVVTDVALFEGKLLISQSRTDQGQNPCWSSLLDFAADTVHIYGYHSTINRRNICNIVTSSYAPVYMNGVPVYTAPTADPTLAHLKVALGPVPGGDLDARTGLHKYLVGIADSSGTTVFYPDETWGRFVDYVTAPTVIGFSGDKVIVSGPYSDGTQVMILPVGLQSINTTIQELYGAIGTNGLVNRPADGKSTLSFSSAGYGTYEGALVLLRRNPRKFRAGMQAIVTKDYTTGWMVGSPVLSIAAERTLGPVASVVDRAGGPDFAAYTGYEPVTRSALADGSDVGVLGGFSYDQNGDKSTRLEQPYNPALDFGFDDFSIVITADLASPVWQALIHRTATKTGWGDTGFFMGMAGPGVTPAANQGKIIAHVGGLQLIGPYVAGTGVRTYELSRTAGVFSLRVDGVLYAQAESQQDMTAVGAVTTVGAYWHRQDGDISHPAGANSATRILTVVVTRYAATEEQALKQAGDIRAIVGRKALLRGITNDVRSVRECSVTGRVAVGTTSSNEVYEGLVNVGGSDAGAEYSAIVNGLRVIAGSWKGSTRIETTPIKHRRRNGKKQSVPLVVQRIAAAGQSAFAAPAGYKILQVSAAGAIKAEGATRDYLIKSDGFKEHAIFAVGLAADTVVQLTVVRK